MVDGAGRFLPESKRGLPVPWVAFTKAFGLARLFPRSPRFNAYHQGHLGEFEVNKVGVLAGAFLWVRSKAIEDVGLLDEAFFMYGEDIDWSYRITQGGYDNYYFPQTSIIHYKGESTKRGSLNYVRVFYNAMIIFAKKHFVGGQARSLVWLMQTAVYVRAVLTVLGNLWRGLRFPLLDAMGIYLGLRAIKYLWAEYHFQDPNYFSETVDYLHFPAYTLLWVLSVFLGGGYERPYDLGRLLKSLSFGTLALLAVYGLLPNTLRPSRALLLLGAAWAATWMLLVRATVHLISYGDLDFTSDDLPRLLIVGSEAESDRALSLLQRAGASRNYLGRIAPPGEEVGPRAAGSASRLLDLVSLYRADELLFCSRDILNADIQTWMSELGPRYAYRTLPEGSSSIIGSQGKNTQGTLYTIDARWAITEPSNRRAKWLLDKGVAVLLLLSWPLHVFFTARGPFRLQNIWRVLTGAATWVGYVPTGQNTLLPSLPPGIVSPARGNTDLDPTTLRHLNLYYAKDYTVWWDLSLLLNR